MALLLPLLSLVLDFIVSCDIRQFLDSKLVFEIKVWKARNLGGKMDNLLQID